MFTLFQLAFNRDNGLDVQHEIVLLQGMLDTLYPLHLPMMVRYFLVIGLRNMDATTSFFLGNITSRIYSLH